MDHRRHPGSSTPPPVYATPPTAAATTVSTSGKGTGAVITCSTFSSSTAKLLKPEGVSMPRSSVVSAASLWYLRPQRQHLLLRCSRRTHQREARPHRAFSPARTPALCFLCRPATGTLRHANRHLKQQRYTDHRSHCRQGYDLSVAARVPSFTLLLPCCSSRRLSRSWRRLPWR